MAVGRLLIPHQVTSGGLTTSHQNAGGGLTIPYQLVSGGLMVYPFCQLDDDGLLVLSPDC